MNDSKHTIRTLAASAGLAAVNAAKSQLLSSLKPAAAAALAGAGGALLARVRGKSQKGSAARLLGPRRRRQNSNTAFGGGIMSSAMVRAPLSNAAVITRGMGVQDTRLHFSYVLGTVYVGNGTLGSSGSVYLKTALSGRLAYAQIPIAPFDTTDYGLAALGNFAKYFAQKRYRSVRVHIRPVATGCSTSAAADIAIAPIRGGAYSFPVSTTTTAPSYSNTSVLSCQGGVLFPSWQPMDIDFTPFVSSAAGTKTFEEGGTSQPATNSIEANADEIPCSFILTGDGGTVSNGQNYAHIYADIDVDLLDWTGGIAASSPEKARDEKVSSHVSHTLMSDYVAVPPPSPVCVATPAEMQQLRLSRQTAAVSQPRG